MRSAPRLSCGAGRPRLPAAVRALVTLAGLVLVTTAACGGAGDGSAALERSAGGMTGRLTMSPEPAAAMKPLRLSVALTDAAGRPAAGRTVAFDLSMPSMTMAPNRPAVSEVGEGVYEATSMLSMPGDWRLIVEIDSPDHRAELPFTFSAE